MMNEAEGINSEALIEKRTKECYTLIERKADSNP